MEKQQVENLYNKIMTFLPLAKTFLGLTDMKVVTLAEYLERSGKFLRKIEVIFKFEGITLDDAQYLMVKYKDLIIKELEKEDAS